MSSSAPPSSEAEAVAAILDRRVGTYGTPKDEDLAPVYTFLLGSAPTADVGDGKIPHWFCEDADPLNRRAATYLIVLFAFKQQGTSKTWIDLLAKVVKGCTRCARAFANARRTWERLYFSTYPANTRRNFASVVDKWQAGLITPHLELGSLLDLPPALLQLAFNEPGVLALPDIAEPLEMAVMSSGNKRTSVADLYLTAGLAGLLSSNKRERRAWARTQIGLISCKPLSWDDLRDSGVGSEVLNNLLGSNYPGTQAELLASLQLLLSTDRLTPRAIKNGLLEGQYTREGARPDKSIMAVVARQLGTPSDVFPTVLEIFNLILTTCPTHHVWAFDTSAELPHTLFSEIKRNSSFETLVATVQPSNSKGKDREGAADDSPLAFITPFLVSVLAAQRAKESSGFSEALAKVANYCFAEMQHDRVEVPVRAAVAEAGFKALAVLQDKTAENDLATTALTSALDVHSGFIARVAFHANSHPAWASARDAARSLVSIVFKADGRDIMESVMGLAAIAQSERRRRKRARRAKLGQNVPDAIRVEKLHRASVRRELWKAVYEAFHPTDVTGLALIMAAVAPFAHIEKLNLSEAWNPEDLDKVVQSQDWIASVRAINSALNTVRTDFARVIESMAAQLDPTILGAMWQQPGVARTAMALVLSPIEAIHDPVINLVQQSFPDVDDRGDCFRLLLEKFSLEAMDGLNDFLSAFIQTARVVPEAVGLAKWLVRCFTDVMDALCDSAGMSPALLQTNSFLSQRADGKWMASRVSILWQLMTDSLALIFKRTADWAPFFDNDVMVDWMRDALIFGRMITDNIRIFESAILSQKGSTSEDMTESPARMSSVGKVLVSKVQVVLADLVGWLRLTDAETLHQAFELLKTILGRVSKSNPDLKLDKTLETTLLELDKFCRRVSSAYRSRISDDMLSELSDLVNQFDLPIPDDDDIQFVKEVKARSPELAGSSDVESVSSKLKAAALKDKRDTKPAPQSTQQKNAFAMMMKKAGGTYTPSEGSSRPKAVKPAKPRQMTLDEFEEEDNLLDNLSTHDLELLERRAQNSSLNKSSAAAKPQPKPKEKLVMKVGPKIFPEKKAPSTSFKSKLMRDLRSEHKAHQSDWRRDAPPVTRLPHASQIGTGIGAYTGPSKPAPKPAAASSDTSDSDSSSEEENKGLTALLARQKGAVKPATKPLAPTRFTIQEKRPIKTMGPSAAEIFRQREEAKRRAHAMKMRLNPDMTPLFRYVLGWNPAHKATTPPYADRVVNQIGPLQPVPTTFTSAEHYDKVMLPMFLQELWAQFLKDEPSTAAVTVEVMQKDYEDDFIDLQAVVAGNMPPGLSFNDSDVVTIQPTAPGGRPAFAKVQNFQRRNKDVSIKLRILREMDPNVGVKGKLLVQKSSPLGTAMREYGALRGFPYYEPGILQDALAARSAPSPTLSNADVKDAIRSFQVNEPQAKAILGAFAVKGFSLIQGPPGTGKTKTISGLVGKFLSDRNMPIASHADAPARPKILVCAPSNAAIDEVCKRLMDGVPSASGGRIHPKVVRIGVEASVNIAVRDVSLDNIVEARVNDESQRRDGGGSELARVQAELDGVKNQIKDKQDQMASVQGNDQKRKELEAELHALNAKRSKLGQQQSRAKDAARDATRHLNGARRAAKELVLKEADIICSTLSGAGQDVLSKYTFETVIIDEAAQAIEMSCLIPLRYGAKRCIMVGDPNQLPPTTFSVEADRNKYNQSLFVRIAQNNGYMNLLSIQYRMHPEISELPSKLFYNSRLKDGPNMAEKTKAVWHKTPIFGPYHFVNVQGQETKAGTSTRNSDEAMVAVDLFRSLESQYGGSVDFTMRIGVITMYKEQLFELKRKFKNAFGEDIVEKIDFNTVDGFQGQEKDIIILSCVRSGPNLSTIGFLKDFRRMNVALTRAKSSLFVLGNASTLERSDQRWNTIVNDARDRGLLVNYERTLFSHAKAGAGANGYRPRQRSPETIIPKAGTLAPPVEQERKRKSSPPDEPAPTKKKRLDGSKSRSASTAPSANGSVSTSKGPSRPSSPPREPPPPPPPSSPPPQPPAPLPPARGGPGPPRGGAPARPRPPPKRPTGEDALFMSRKKKPAPRQGQPGPPPTNIRAAVNSSVASGRRPPRPS